MNNNLLNTLENQAMVYFKNKKKVSYDETTRLVVKNISWKVESNFSEEINSLHNKTKCIERLDFYYEQILREVSMDSSADLEHGEYINFWENIDKLDLSPYFLKFKDKTITESNLFGFLSMLKRKITEKQFINNFKLKSLQMIEVKKGFSNE